MVSKVCSDWIGRQFILQKWGQRRIKDFSMRILIACDKFKGSLSALEACQALRDGFSDEDSSLDLVVCPVADGGEGFAEAIVSAQNGRWHFCEASDALGRPIEARYGMIDRPDKKQAAVIEMAEASGLYRILGLSPDVLRSSSFGTGSLIRSAVEQGAQRILLGIGGSATNDAGIGVLTALGVKFLNECGEELDPIPASLEALAEVDSEGMISLPPIDVACDVENPLLGPNGATMVYGPQKGASEDELQLLEAGLGHLVEVSGLGELAKQPGTGAAGGLGFGLLGFAGAQLREGFEMVAEALGLADQVAQCDVVLTGEGSIDRQTFDGKAPMGVARLARASGKKVIAVGGRVKDLPPGQNTFDQVLSLEALGLTEAESMGRAGELLRIIGAGLAKEFTRLRGH